MKIELSEDYEEKIMSGINERRKNAQNMRKKVLSIVIIFACLFGITSMGYCQFKKNEYTNYFISDSENQLIEDEYQYFDGLGIKLNFINYAEDSIVIGINFKYEDISNIEFFIEKYEVLDINTGESFDDIGEKSIRGEKNKISIKKESKNELIYMIEMKTNNIKKINDISIEINKVKISDKDGTKTIDINYKKIVEKGKE